jgi:DNA-binding transcriptional ArsR family regulator/uncharacterized protein YndB with AHSA1/START domain
MTSRSARGAERSRRAGSSDRRDAPVSAGPAGIDEVFKALADATRRQLLDTLHARGGLNLRELCAGVDMARQSVSKHLAILEAAGLVATVRDGREKLHFVNAAPINEIAERWISQYDQHRVDALSDLKRALESTDMTTNDTTTKDTTTPSFVYKTYIKTTPEALFRALTEPAFTQRYWRLSFDTDWQVGSTMTWENNGVTIADPEQVVLEYDPYRRLAYTWHTFTPELGAKLDMDEELTAALGAEPRSKVTFDLEPEGSMVLLTVVHDGFPEASRFVELVGNGWPRVLSDLKTFLETGAVLPTDA